VVWAESPPDNESGRPTITRSASVSCTTRTSSANPRLVAGLRIGSRGVASVPEGSLTATPQRAEP
jgi:hypothetical protein